MKLRIMLVLVTCAAALQASGPFSGEWKPRPTPERARIMRDLTLIYTKPASGEGVVFSDGEGPVFAGAMDGKPHASMRKDGSTMSFEVVSEREFALRITTETGITTIERLAIIEDGNEMIRRVTVKADGAEPKTDAYLYTRMPPDPTKAEGSAAADKAATPKGDTSNLLFGRWYWKAGDSRLAGLPQPIVVSEQGGVLTWQIPPHRFSVRLDGKEVNVAQGEALRTRMLKVAGNKVDERTVQIRIRRDGSAETTARFQVAPDDRTMTVTVARGDKRDTTVYERSGGL